MCYLSILINNILYPFKGFLYIVIDARLKRSCTVETSTGNKKKSIVFNCKFGKNYG